MKNLIKNVVLVALGTLTAYGSEKKATEIDNRLIVTEDKIKEFLLTEKPISGKVKLSLDTDKEETVLVKLRFEKDIPGKHYQRIKNKHGYLLVDVDVLNKKKEPIEGVVSNSVTKIIEINACNKMVQYSDQLTDNKINQSSNKANLDIFPRYPIVLHSSTDPLSLRGLTLIPNKVYYAAAKRIITLANEIVEANSFLSNEIVEINSAKSDLANKAFIKNINTGLADTTWGKCLQTIEDYKLGFSNEKGIFEKGKTIEDYQSFQLTKEELFTLLYEVNSNKSKPYSDAEFLNYIYEKDKELNSVFFGNKPISSIADDKGVYEKLTSKDMDVRNTVAKALLLHILFHPDIYSRPELNANFLVLTQNYGQVARWLHHIHPDNDFGHLYTYNEFKHMGNLRPLGSFWVLKEGQTYIDFYKILLGIIAGGTFTYQVINVEIKQTKVKNYFTDTVVIDIACKKGDLKNFVSQMKSVEMNSLDLSHNTTDTNGMRFVVRYNGLWELVSAFPLNLKNLPSEIEQSGCVLEELKNFVDLEKFPRAKEYFVEIPGTNVGITKSIKK